MDELIRFFFESVFAGSCTVTLLSIIIFAVKRKSPINPLRLTEAINITLLASAVVNLLLLIYICIKATILGQDARFVVINRLFGHYAYAQWIILFIWTLLPQVFWFRKIRKSPVWLLAIVMGQVMFKLMQYVLQWETLALRDKSTWNAVPGISIIAYSEHLLAYLVIVTAVYYMLSRLKATSRSSSTQ